MIELIETSIERIQGDDYCCVYTGERKFINQLKELAKNYSEVNIININKDGSILAHVPYEWFRFIKPKATRNYTSEQREAMKERMRKARENKGQNI